MFKLFLPKFASSFFVGLLVGWLYAFSTQESVKNFSNYLYSNLGGCPDEGQSSQSIFFLSTLRRLVFFSCAALLSVLILRQDPIIFGCGVIFAIVAFSVINLGD